MRVERRRRDRRLSGVKDAVFRDNEGTDVENQNWDAPDVPGEEKEWFHR